MPTMRRLAFVCLAFGIGACGDDGGGGDTTPPTVLSTTPASGTAGVWLHAPIVVTFSEPVMVPITGVSLRDAAGTQITPEIDVVDATLTLRVGEGYAVFGTLDLMLGDAITDLAGNPLVPTTAGTWTLDPWALPTAGLDRGMNPSTPDIAIDDDDVAYVTWSAGSVGARRIYVGRVDGDGVTALGGELGAGDSALSSIAIDAQNRVVVLWTEFAGEPSIQAARWDGTAWLALPSPGDGAYGWMGGGGEGNGAGLLAVWQGAGTDPVFLKASVLVDDAWQPLPDTPFFRGPTASLPSVVVTSATTALVAFVDADSNVAEIRLQERDGNLWREGQALPLGRPGPEPVRFSVVTDGTDNTIAYDIWNGFSYDVQVWSRPDVLADWIGLGLPLDIDPPANAQAPTIALDAAGVPIVAWRERVEGNWRGFAARFEESNFTWTPIGGDAWNDDPAISIVRPRMVLWRGRVPVIAWGTSDVRTGAQSVRVSQFNGPATPRPGIPARVSIAGCSFSMQATLSQTGCFPTIGGGKATPHPGLVPFDLRSELWSDGALKRRWIALPDGGVLNGVVTGAWTAPVGTILIKEFAIETTPGDGTTRRVMETRFLVNTGAATWDGYSYRWRADGSDADLLPDAATTVDWMLDDGNTHTHSYPSRAQCAQCHHPSVGPILGLKTGNIARRFDYDGIVADQLTTFMDIGIITSAGIGGPVFTAPHDTGSVELRMRGYLEVNCSHCHNPGGVRPTRDFRWETPLASTMICGVVTPGDPGGSLIRQRVATRPGMPPLATLQVDPLIVGVLDQWISSITACP
jgi:hypothetical protein